MGRSLWSEDGSPLSQETASADSDNRKKLRSTVLAAVSKYCSQDLKVLADCHVLHLIAIGDWVPLQDPTISAEAVRRCKDFAASPNDATAALQHSSRRCYLQKFLEPAISSTFSCSAML